MRTAPAPLATTPIWRAQPSDRHARPLGARLAQRLGRDQRRERSAKLRSGPTPGRVASRPVSATPLPTLVWTPEAPDRGWLRRMGYAVLAYSNLCSAFVAPARAVGLKRTSLASPVQPLLDRYARHAGVAVLDAQLDTLEDLQTLYGFVLEPAHRAGCRLVVHAPRTLDELDP